MLLTSHLSFSYPSHTSDTAPVEAFALQDININLNQGNIIGLVGANGSGKSTLLMNLMGIVKPTVGSVEFNGQALRYDKKSLRQLRQQVTLVFQEPDQQIFYTDIESDLAFSLRNLGMDETQIKRRINAALQQVDALHFRHKPIQYLSYGQKKRIAIAGALVLDTDYLLLDEPSAGLDPQGREHIIQLILSIANQGKHVLICSHDIDLIYQICDYIYVLEKGKISLSGVPQTVFLETQALAQAQLTQPWLVKVHLQYGLPLCQTEQQLWEHRKTA